MNPNKTPNQDARQSRKADSVPRGPHLIEEVGKNLPQENREAIERWMSDATEYAREARTYVRENPGEAAGLALTAGAVLWALFGTKPGRYVFEAGSAAAMPAISSWIAKNFNQLDQNSTH